MTESSPIISISPSLVGTGGPPPTPPGNSGVPADSGVPGSAGSLMPLTEAKIVDLDSGRALDPTHPGELWVRGPQVMQGEAQQ